ncbi:MAG: hypothetical protein H0W88_10835 [Parachlamydiaceae bacterium]|nr:hypothetical protein [Parachlamydiaceae bacterium]
MNTNIKISGTDGESTIDRSKTITQPPTSKQKSVEQSVKIDQIGKESIHSPKSQTTKESQLKGKISESLQGLKDPITEKLGVKILKPSTEKFDKTVSESQLLEAKRINEEIAALLKNLDRSNARETLQKVKEFPKNYHTLQVRLACMKADPKIETWEALTYPSAKTLLEEKNKGVISLKAFLRKPGIWLPEIDRINLKIMENMLIRLGRVMTDNPEFPSDASETRKTSMEVAAFQRTMTKPQRTKKKSVTIARGAPSAGKTSYLQGVFALACDDIKVTLLNHFLGLNSQQTHFQSTAITDSFRDGAEKMFGQALTTDALFVSNEAIIKKIAEAKKNKQQTRMTDIHVDLKTLCCRILKRTPYEPIMNFKSLSDSYQQSLVNRKSSIDLVKENLNTINEYKITSWKDGRFVTVAELDPETNKINIIDQDEYNRIVNANQDAIAKEIVDIGKTVITDDFIAEFIRGMPTDAAAVFKTALEKYKDKTLGEALNAHSEVAIEELSAGARVIQKALPSF